MDREGEIGGHRAGSGIYPGRALTRREREVLEQAAIGMSNRQIGEVLEIADRR